MKTQIREQMSTTYKLLIQEIGGHHHPHEKGFSLNCDCGRIRTEEIRDKYLLQINDASKHVNHVR